MASTQNRGFMGSTPMDATSLAWQFKKRSLLFTEQIKIRIAQYCLKSVIYAKIAVVKHTGFLELFR